MQNSIQKALGRPNSSQNALEKTKFDLESAEKANRSIKLVHFSLFLPFEAAVPLSNGIPSYFRGFLVETFPQFIKNQKEIFLKPFLDD